MWFLLVGVVACGDSSSKLPPTISVSPTNLSVAAGATLDVTASYEDADGVKTPAADATWTVAGSTIASITVGTNGHAAVHGIAMGHTSLTITGQGSTATFVIVVTGSTAVTLTDIEVTPNAKSIALGTTQQMTATGMYSDGSKKDITATVAWSSSATDHATIAATGIATSVAVGPATISAVLDGITGSTTLTVTDIQLVSIAVTPADAHVTVGLTQQYTATGTYTNQTTQDLTTQVTWASSTAAASVSNAAGSQGLVSALVVGPAMISATKGTVTGSATLTVAGGVLTAIVVTPPDPSAAVGTKRQFTATGTFSDSTHQDITSQVTWTSSDAAIATVDAATGEATAVAAGSATITATLGTVSGSTTLTVTNAVVTSIAVTPENPSTALGHHVQFTATATFDNNTTQDLTKQVIWTSTNETVATVSNAAADAGDATTHAETTTMIIAAFNAVSGATLLTVTPAVLDSITVTPASTSVLPGGKQQFVATGNNSDGTHPATLTVTWASSVEATATIAADGLATGVAVGTTVISATSGTGTDAVVGSTPFAVRGPGVVTSQPRDTAFGIRTSTPIVVTFDQKVAAASLTTQAANGACTGSIQLSADNFASCLAFTGAVALDATALVATAQPAAALSAATTYKLRVTSDVTNQAGGAGVPFTQATGFTSSAAGTCASGLVISQVYGAGGNGGANAASFLNDFIELHNGGATPINLDGFAVQYASSAGTTWQVTPLPAVVLAAGGYYLIAEAAGVGPAPALPTPDLIAAAPISMAAGNGKVALTASTVPLPDGCTLAVPLSNDFVGYGTANCKEGTVGATAALGNKLGALRKTGGCTDATDNAGDFTVDVPTPRNAATAASVCACFASFDDDGEPAMSFLSDN